MFPNPQMGTKLQCLRNSMFTCHCLAAFLRFLTKLKQEISAPIQRITKAKACEHYIIRRGGPILQVVADEEQGCLWIPLFLAPLSNTRITAPVSPGTIWIFRMPPNCVILALLDDENKNCLLFKETLSFKESAGSFALGLIVAFLRFWQHWNPNFSVQIRSA